MANITEEASQLGMEIILAHDGDHFLRKSVFQPVVITPQVIMNLSSMPIQSNDDPNHNLKPDIF